MEISALLIVSLLIAFLVVFTVVRAVRIVPQARARNVERLGRYSRTLRQPVITEDNLVVEIDTVLYFQVTDPRPRCCGRRATGPRES